jgi:hypothetical protein
LFPVGDSTSRNTVSIVLPVDGFVNVARLVVAGLGSQLSFGFEAIDDLQLAIELALRSVAAPDGVATAELSSDGEGLTVTVTGPGPIDQRVLDGADGLDLRSCLVRLVDRVEVPEGPVPTVVLRKNRQSAEVVPGV